MHELSIALSILDCVAEQMQSHAGSRVVSVHLKVGPLSGVVPRALVAAYGLAREGSIAPDSELEIDQTPLTIFCEYCGQEQPAESPQCLCCVICGQSGHQVMSGRELDIVALELET